MIGACVDSTSAAILAGGQARRFGGQDKSRLVVHGRSIIVRQVEVLQRVADEVFVVARDPERFADLGLDGPRRSRARDRRDRRHLHRARRRARR